MVTRHLLLLLLAVVCLSDYRVNGQGQRCVRTEVRMNICKKSCNSNDDCRGDTKQCLCDGDCGWSCVNPLVVCPELEVPANTNVGYETRRFNTLVSFVCHDTYVIRGSSTRRCQGNATWSGESPTCVDPGQVTDRPVVDEIEDSGNGERGGCPAPLVVENANHDGSGEAPYAIGTIVTYSCHFGFYRQGLSRAVCRDDGWFGPVNMECFLKSCGDPGDLLHGSRQGEVFTFGNEIVHQCDLGYELRGSAWRVCQADGMWSGIHPTCEPVRCPAVRPVDYGDAHGSEVTFGSTVRYTCDDGYRVAGLPHFANIVVRRCEADARWNGTDVRCEVVDCGDPGHLYNGRISSLNSGRTTHGSVISFRCDSDTTMVGEHSSVCNDDGQWSNPLPVCYGRCGKPDVSNGRLYSAERRKSYFEHGASLRFYCYSDHQKNRDESARCDNGTWSFIPECIPDPCRQSKDVPGSVYSLPDGAVVSVGTMVRHDVTLSLSCDPGYQLQRRGVDEFTCDKGDWDPSLSACEGESCSVPRISGARSIYKVVRTPTTDRLYENEDVDHGHGIQVVCSNTHQLTGTAIAWCSLGNLGQVPTCDPRPCEMTSERGTIYKTTDWPRVTLNGGDSVQHEHQVRIECEASYEIEDDVQRRCHYGRWLPGDTEDLPKCAGRACPVPNVDHGYCTRPGRDATNEAERLSRHDTIPNEQFVHCYCDEGYVLQGEETPQSVSCRFGRLGAHPGCQPEPCTLEQTIGTVYTSHRGITIQRSSVPNGFSITISCENGYNLQSESHEVTCAFGQWSSEWNTCEPVKCDAPEISGGQISPLKAEYNYRERITIQCPERYTLQGRGSVRCGTDGWGWNQDEPTRCIAEPCFEVEDDDMFSNVWYNSTIDEDQVPHGTSVTVTCAEGMVPVSTHATCNKGRWIPSEPACDLPQCTAPELPARIRLQRGPLRPGVDKVYHNTRALAYCSSGYVHVEPDDHSYKRVLCIDGSWNRNTDCISEPCYFNPTMDISDIYGAEDQNNGRYKVAGGETITIRCDDRREVSAVCDGASFKPASPSCLVRQHQGCQPPNITLGYAKELGTERNITEPVDHDTQARVLCHQGLSLSDVDTSIIMCQEGVWNISILECVPDPCEVPELTRGQYPAGVTPGKRRINGSAIFYRCGDQDVISKCVRGRWVPPVDGSGCLPPGWCESPDIQTGEVKPNTGNGLYPSGSEITVTCGRDQRLVKAEYTCEGGMWQPRVRQPECMPYCENGADSSFSERRHCHLLSYNTKTIHDISKDECTEQCLTQTDFLCMSFDYKVEDGSRTCYLSKSSVKLRPRKLTCRSGSTTSYYERTCSERAGPQNE